MEYSPPSSPESIPIIIAPVGGSPPGSTAVTVLVMRASVVLWDCRGGQVEVLSAISSLR